MDVRLPNLGEGADSGSVVNVQVKEGDQVKKGQILLELENEKAVAPIPSPADGKVTAIRVKAGDKVTVGQIIVILDGGSASDGVVEKAAPVRQDPRPAAPVATVAPAVSGTAPAPPTEMESRVLPAGMTPPASPSIRKMARDLGIDLSRVRGSESGGRIVLGDLREYVERLQQLAFGAKPAAPAKTEPEVVDFSKWGPITRQPLSSLRKIIAQRMVESWTTIPQVNQFDEADVTDLMDLRKKWHSAYEAQGARLTLTCFALKAVAHVLRQFPVFNSSLDDAAQELVLKNYYHIGLAVDTEAGLIVPVIKDVDKKSVLALAKELGELAVKARDRKIALEELKGGTFTISNQGGIGGGHFTPIINKPEVAILGLGRSTLKPVIRDGQVVPRHVLPLCLSYDHRVIDGGSAARFIVELVRELEQFKDADVMI